MVDKNINNFDIVNLFINFVDNYFTKCRIKKTEALEQASAYKGKFLGKGFFWYGKCNN
jgi:hypothetical protein